MISNQIIIKSQRISYFKKKFDTTYPKNLRGIISQDEFQHSISRINHSTSTDPRKRITINLLSTSLIFITMCIIAGEFMTDFRDTWITILVSLTMATIAFISAFTALFMIHRQRTQSMVQAVIEESLKYSTRKVKACTWELYMSNPLLGMYSFTTKITISINTPSTSIIPILIQTANKS